MLSTFLDGRLTQVSAPALEPVTTAEAKAHLRVEHADEDDLIGALVKTSRQRIEAFLSRALIEQTWDVVYECFPRDGVAIELPLPPLQSVTSVTYIDLSGDAQTWASSNYTVEAPAGEDAPHGRIVPKFLTEYPVAARYASAVTVRFVAGFGPDPTDVPEVYRRALLADLAHLYENREAGIAGRPLPRNVQDLLGSVSVHLGFA